MASRLRGHVGFLSPFVSKKYVYRIARRLKELTSTSTVRTDCLQDASKNVAKDKLHDTKFMTQDWFKIDTSLVEVESIYKTLPNAHTALTTAKPEPRFIWKESQQGFPDTPEEANVDVMTFLEQRDCYNRLKKLKVHDFCVGSIVAVNRADPYVPKGQVRFVGICIAKNHWQNTLGATFTLRNVIDGEPMEVNFQLYSPIIQKIEVLKHERRDKPALRHLRDHPPADSYVSENMKALPYRKQPSLYVQSKEEGLRIQKWFDQIRKHKRRR